MEEGKGLPIGKNKGGKLLKDSKFQKKNWEE